MAEVSRKSVLMECLEYERDLWKLTSEGYDMRVPMQGMEDLFAEQRKKCEILQEMIHALDSEPVRHVLANWQQEVMKNGPTMLKLDGPEEDAKMTGGNENGNESAAEH